jgi:surface polysaccharide O-acyltransferase-like enzyme
MEFLYLIIIIIIIMPLITDETIHNNRPGITLVDKLSKTVYFIDIAIPNNHNLHAKYAENWQNIQNSQ